MAFGDVVGTVKTFASDSATSAEITLDASPVVGNLIAIAHYTGDADSQARGTALEAVPNSDATNSDQAVIYYRVVQSGDGTAWGANSAGTEQQSLVVVQLEGPMQASPLDQTATQAFATSNSTTYASGTTGTTAQNDEIAIVAVAHRTVGGVDPVSGATAPTWDNSFTHVGWSQSADNTASEKGLAMGRRTLTATGTFSSTVTFADSAARGGGLIATFKKDAGGGGGIAIPVVYHHRQRNF